MGSILIGLVYVMCFIFGFRKGFIRMFNLRDGSCWEEDMSVREVVNRSLFYYG